MTVFQELLSATFDNIPVLVPTEKKSAGKKIAESNYPNSSRRSLEELGAKLADYNLTFIISGSDAVQRRIDLERALVSEGQKLFIHPVLGQIMVTATDYTSDSSDKSIGEFIFNVTLKEGDPNITLTPTSVQSQNISALADVAAASLDDSFIDQFINNAPTDTIKQSITQVNSLVASIGSLTSGLVSPVESELADLNNLLSNTTNLTNTLPRSGNILVNQMRSIYNQFQNISPAIDSYYNSWVSLFSFGETRVKKSLITQKRINEENNLSAHEDHTRLNGLIYAYEAASYADFYNDQQLTSTQDELERAYEALVLNADVSSMANNPDFRSNINNLRIFTRKVFEQKAQNVWRIVDIDPNESSMSLIAYRFYGNLDRLESLINLNPLVNVSVSNDSIKGLS